MTLQDLANLGEVIGAIACVIRAMATIDSDGCRPPIPGQADHLLRQHGVQFFRNTGIGGRLGLESVDDMLQNPGQQI